MRCLFLAPIFGIRYSALKSSSSTPERLNENGNSTSGQGTREWWERKRKLESEERMRKALVQELEEHHRKVVEKAGKGGQGAEREEAGIQRIQNMEERIRRLEEELRNHEKEQRKRNTEADWLAEREEENRRRLGKQLREQEARRAEERDLLIQQLNRLDTEREEWEKERQELEGQLRDVEAGKEIFQLKEKLEAVERRLKDRREIDHFEERLIDHGTQAGKEREVLMRQISEHEKASRAYMQQRKEREEDKTRCEAMEEELETLVTELLDDAKRGTRKVKALARKLEEERRAREALEKELTKHDCMIH